jgi:hypothetical protein
MLSFQSPIARQVLAKLVHKHLYLLLGARSWPFLTSRPIISLPNNYLSSSAPSDTIFPFRSLVLPRRYPIPETLSFATCIGVCPVSPVSPQRQTYISTISMPSTGLHLWKPSAQPKMRSRCLAGWDKARTSAFPRYSGTSVISDSVSVELRYTISYLSMFDQLSGFFPLPCVHSIQRRCGDVSDSWLLRKR